MHPPNQINPVDQIVLADRRIRVVLCAVTCCWTFVHAFDRTALSGGASAKEISLVEFFDVSLWAIAVSAAR